jgi:hypothetical protein
MKAVAYRVAVRSREVSESAFPADTTAVPYFPDGCPREVPAGWPVEESRYAGPHRRTVCPSCLPRWRGDHLVSEPFRVPQHAPVTFPIGPPVGPSRAEVGLDSDPVDLLDLLHDAGFWPVEETVTGQPTVVMFDREQVRVVLDDGTVEIHLFGPPPARLWRWKATFSGGTPLQVIAGVLAAAGVPLPGQTAR